MKILLFSVLLFLASVSLGQQSIRVAATKSDSLFVVLMSNQFGLVDCNRIDGFIVETEDSNRVYYLEISPIGIGKTIRFCITSEDTLCSFADRMFLFQLQSKKSEFCINDSIDLIDILKNVKGIRVEDDQKSPTYIIYQDTLLGSKNGFSPAWMLCEFEDGGFITTRIKDEFVSISSPIESLYNSYTDGYKIFIVFESFDGIRYHKNFPQFRSLFYDPGTMKLVFDEIRSRYDENVIRH